MNVLPRRCAGVGVVTQCFPPLRGLSVARDKGRREKKVYDRHQGGLAEESLTGEFFNLVTLVSVPYEPGWVFVFVGWSTVVV